MYALPTPIDVTQWKRFYSSIPLKSTFRERFEFANLVKTREIREFKPLAKISRYTVFISFYSICLFILLFIVCPERNGFDIFSINIGLLYMYTTYVIDLSQLFYVLLLWFACFYL